MSASEKQTAEASAWAPLRIAAFRSLWLAVLASNIGTWMQTVGMHSVEQGPLLNTAPGAAGAPPAGGRAPPRRPPAARRGRSGRRRRPVRR
ncbi:MFS transporter [Micromonospora siamensis]|uniref:MFS transporter n=1 Tax=Micromonospora siamensis TaxID=299152 RepID=UPI0012FD83DC